MAPAGPEPASPDSIAGVPSATGPEPYFRLLFGDYATPMWVYDTETFAFLEVNEAALRRYGYRRDQFLAMRITDLRPPEDWPALLAFLAEEHAATHRRLTRHRCADGSLLEVEIVSHPLPFNGRPARLVVAAPATETSRSEGALFFQAQVLEAVEQAVIATDAGGRIQYWNGGAARLWGLPAEQAQGRPLLDVLLPPALHTHALPLFVQQMQGARWSTELTVRGPDGAELPVLVSASPITSAGGTVAGVIVVAQDITAQHRHRQTLQFLAGVNSALAASLDERATLQALASACVPFLADWALVDVRGPERLERLGFASVMPDAAATGRAILAARALQPASRSNPVEDAIATGRSLLAADVTAAVIDRFARSPEHRRTLDLLGAHSVMVVPLRAWGTPAGALTLVSSQPARRYTAEDLELAEEVARRAALAIERSRRYDAEAAARHAAELAVERLTRLQRVSAALAGALTEVEVSDVIVREAAAAMGATHALLAVPAEGREYLRIASTLGYPAGAFRGLRMPLTEAVPESEAFRDGRVVLSSSRQERERRYPAMAALREGIPGEARICVPLLLGATATGTLGLTFAERREFSAEEQAFLLAIGRQGAQALDRARLYDAERAARDRMTLLFELSAELAGSLDYDETLQRVARLAVPLAGDLCVVNLLEPSGEIRRVVTHSGYPEDSPVLRWLHTAATGHTATLPAVRVLTTGMAETNLAITDADLAAAARDEAHLEMLRALALRSFICLPLTIGGRTCGSLTLARTRTGHYTEQDVRLVEELARRTSQAMENARLYREAQETARRERAGAAQLRLLAGASLAISAARTVEAIGRQVMETARDLTGAGIAIATVTEDDTLREGALACWVAARHAGWGYAGHLPATGIIAEAIAAGAVLRRSRAEVDSPGIMGVHPPLSGWLSAPLLGRDGHLLGAVCLSDAAQGEFSEQDEDAIRQLGQMAAAAVENLLLSRSAAAAEAAIQADALKTQLLNTVSHELRTPLGAIKGFTSNLLHFGEAIQSSERHEFLGEIDEAADRLTELVENLLHLSRQESGVLEVQREPVALGMVLARAVEDARARYPGREISLRLPPGLPPVEGDPRRLLQVAANLIDNALKYSPGGGPVTVRVAAAARAVRFTVADRGLGIPTTHQARVFDRFYRVPGPQSIAIGGTGLGLAITRHIVEQHGGRIGLRSREGQGTMVTVILPRVSLPS